MYVAIIPNRGSPPAILLREGYRDNGKTKNRTLANLSHWPSERIEQLRAVLRGEPAPGPPTSGERGRALLQLVEGEFRYYGPGPALRRLARTGCYFARFLPDFPAFRAAVHAVRDLAGFRRLVREHFG